MANGKAAQRCSASGLDDNDDGGREVIQRTALVQKRRAEVVLTRHARQNGWRDQVQALRHTGYEMVHVAHAASLHFTLGHLAEPH